jgi:glycosyltransferase involved in cell wall biosynthesis
MRIAFFGDGSLIHVRRWVGYFHERAHEVLLLSFERVEGCPFPAQRLHRRLPTKLLGYLSAMGPIRGELERFRPDLVSALYIGGYGFAAMMSGWRPLAVSSLGSDLLVDYRSSIVHRLQIRSVLRNADLVITDADELSRVATSIGASPGKILKAYLGIDTGIFFPRGEAPAGPPRDDGRARIVSTRNLYPVYRVELLIEAARLVRKKRDALFVICGDGPGRKGLEERVKRLGLERSFIFRGRLESREIARELRAADVYVSTSRSDSTSVSLLEAMGCGAFPVVTDLAANREWITNRENGLITKGRDPASLAAAVLEALGNDALRARAREINVHIIGERGLWKDNMRRVEDAFLRLTGNNTPP